MKEEIEGEGPEVEKGCEKSPVLRFDEDSSKAVK
jgi:hypothetical protein